VYDKVDLRRCLGRRRAGLWNHIWWFGCQFSQVSSARILQSRSNFSNVLRKYCLRKLPFPGFHHHSTILMTTTLPPSTRPLTKTYLLVKTTAHLFLSQHEASCIPRRKSWLKNINVSLLGSTAHCPWLTPLSSRCKQRKPSMQTRQTPSPPLLYKPPLLFQKTFPPHLLCPQG